MAQNEDSAPRQWHNGTSAYVLPNDNPEHQRLESQAIAFEKLMFNNVFRAPVDQPKRILDIGCGTGRCTVALAAKFPNAQVIGVDLSPVPAIHKKPENVEYVQGNIKELVCSNDPRFREGSFDYIFARLLVLGMTDWPGYIDDVAKLLAPDGWAEEQEVDMQLKDLNDVDVVTENWAIHCFADLMHSKNLNQNAGASLADFMEKSGLTNVQQDIFWWPILPLPEKPETDLVQAMVAKLPYAMLVSWDKLATGIYTKERIEEAKEEQMKMHDPQFRKKGEHYNFHVVCGRKSG